MRIYKEVTTDKLFFWYKEENNKIIFVSKLEIDINDKWNVYRKGDEILINVSTESFSDDDKELLKLYVDCNNNLVK